jgi:hypothetical protein
MKNFSLNNAGYDKDLKDMFDNSRKVSDDKKIGKEKMIERK